MMNTPNPGAVDLGVRRRAILRRWTDVAMLAVIGSAIVAVFGTHYISCAQLAKLGPGATIATAVIVAVTAYVTGGRSPLIATVGMRHLATYPPFWVPSILGFGLLATYVATFPIPLDSAVCALDRRAMRAALQPGLVLVPLVPLVLAIAGTFARRIAARRDRAEVNRVYRMAAPAQELGTAAFLAGDFSAQKRWFSNDEPVGNPTLNAFDHYAIAQRLARHFTGPEQPSIALVGRVGSGKSTILAMALYELSRTGRIGADVSVVRVSLWPFDTVDAAIRGVLEALTKELSKHINTLPLFGLPSRYADAIEGVAAQASFAAKLLRSSDAPSTVLRAYDDAASAIGLRLVLWIEDVERFTGMHAGDDAAEVSRLAPLRSLMNELSGRPSIQVVLSAAVPSYRFELEKFARYVEGVPPIDENAVYQILSTFRRGCLAEFPGDIDPASPKAREALWRVEPSDAHALALRFSRLYMPAHHAIRVMCETPRTLKYALRDCHDAWVAMHGEIDFDDLLIMSIFGAAEPTLKALVIDHIRDFQHGVDRETKKKGEQPEVERALEELLAGRSARTRAAVERLLLTLFPNWRTGESSASPDKPQGISAMHTDYWTRYLKRQPVPAEASDQRLLAVIAAWRSGKTTALPDQLVRTRADERVTTFLRSECTSDDLVRLLRDVVDSEMAVPSETWRMEHFALGVSALWATLLEKLPEDPSTLEAAVLESIEKCFPARLPTAYSLAKLFGAPGRDVRPVFDQAARTRIVQAFRRRFLAAYIDAPAALAGALREAAVEVLYQSCALAAVLPQDGKVPSEWQGVREAITQAAEADPTGMAPQVSLFVITTTDVIRPDHHFDETKAAALFDSERLLDAVAKATVTPVADWAVPYLSALVAHAKGQRGL